MKRNFYYYIFFIVVLIFCFSHITIAQNNSISIIGSIGIEKVTKINIEVNQNGLVKVEEELSLNETTAKILIPKQVENLLIFDSKNNELGHELIQRGEEQLLKIYLTSPENKNVKFSYSTQTLTRKNASTWTFKFSSLGTPRVTIIKIEFPERANVTSLKTNQTLYFYPPNLASPLFLYPQDEEINFEIDYFITEESKTRGEGDSLLIYFVIILIVIAMFFVAIFLYKKRRTIEMMKKQEMRKEVDEKSEEEVKEDTEGKETKLRAIKSSVLNMLDENEKKVIEMLYNSKEEEITQAYIYKTLNIPKASLSNVIKRLEQRNLIEKKKYGRVNWIKLKEWIFD